MTELDGNKVTGIQAFSILSLTLVLLGSAGLTPAMSVLAQHFAGQNVSFIVTVATLGGVTGALSASYILGIIAPKKLATITSFVCLASGLLPLMFDNFYILLVDRFIFGFSLGILSPIGNSLILMHYQGAKRNSMMGYRTIMMNLGGIILSFCCGFLAAVDWRAAFFVHLLFVIPFVFSFFLPEDIKVEKPSAKEAKEAKKTAEKMNYKVVLLIAGFLFIYQTMNMSVVLNVSNIFVLKNAGGAAAAGTALTFYTAAGLAAGALFSKLFPALKRLNFLVYFAVVAVGTVVLFTATSPVVLTIGVTLMGAGYNWIYASAISWVGMATPRSTMGKATSLLVCAMNLGGFFSSFWIIALNNNPDYMMIALIALSAVFGILLTFFNPFTAKKQEPAKAASNEPATSDAA